MKKTYFLLIVIGILKLGGCPPANKTTQAESSIGWQKNHFRMEQIRVEAKTNVVKHSYSILQEKLLKDNAVAQGCIKRLKT